MQKRWKRYLSVFLTLAMIAMPFVSFKEGKAASKPKLNKTKAVVSVNKKITLKVKNQIKGSKYTWKTSNKKIATVTKKGVVKGKKAGKATITCKVKAPKKTYNLKCKVTVKAAAKVNKKATVTTQAQLNSALQNKKVTAITIATEQDSAFEIPEGNYSSKTLVVNAPNAEIDNSGVFESITIQAIKDSTFHERAKGNKIYNHAKKARVVVEANAQVEELSSLTANAEFTVEIAGQVKNLSFTQKTISKVTVNKAGSIGTLSSNASDTTLDLSVKGKVTNLEISQKTEAKITVEENAQIDKISSNGTDSNLDVVANGEVKEIAVEKKTTLFISGTTTTIAVTVNGNNSVISSSVTVTVKVNAITEIKLEKGAENSAIEKTKDSTLTIENKTETKVEIKVEGGSTITVEIGTEQKIEAEQSTTTTPGTSGGGGGSTGGGSSSSTEKVTVTKITLSENEADLISGKSLSLTASIEPENATDKTLEWTSSNENIAVVDSKGTITAGKKATGSAIITAKAKDGSEVSAACNVTVYSSKKERAEVKINALIEAGKTEEITIDLLQDISTDAKGENLASYQATIKRNGRVSSDIITNVNSIINQITINNINPANCQILVTTGCAIGSKEGKMLFQLPALNENNYNVNTTNNRIYVGKPQRATDARNDSFNYQYNTGVSETSLGTGIFNPEDPAGTSKVNIAFIQILKEDAHFAHIPVLYSLALDDNGSIDGKTEKSAGWKVTFNASDPAVKELIDLWHPVTDGKIGIEMGNDVIVITYTVETTLPDAGRAKI